MSGLVWLIGIALGVGAGGTALIALTSRRARAWRYRWLQYPAALISLGLFLLLLRLLGVF